MLCMDYRLECLHTAIRHGSLRGIRALQKLCDLDFNDHSCYQEYYGTCLHVAVRYNHDNPALLEALIQAGACVHELDYYGVSPLWDAISNQCSDKMILVLLRHGADLYNGGYNGIPILRVGLYSYPWSLFVPYTRGHRRWKQLRGLFKASRVLKAHYFEAVHRVWRPGGVGYNIAYQSFKQTLAISR